MVKILNGSELAGFIKERQAKQVRSLRQANGIIPKLAIIQTKDDAVIDTYVRLKRQYGADIQAEVDIYKIDQSEVEAQLEQLNADDSVHGIIVQLPLSNPEQTDELVALVSASKDVDALGSAANFEPATPMAILWLLAGYNIDLRSKKVLLVGKGKLVGAPLYRMLTESEVEVSVADRSTGDLRATVLEADVVITATGKAGIITADMLKPGAVLVDAGVASEGGKTIGDVAAEVYEKRDDLTITPTKGGVGPLTVCALFDNVIRAARRQADQQ